MATENPMRILDNRGAGKWSPSRSAATFASSPTNVVNDELGSLRMGHSIDTSRSYVAPNRSGSAPPSIEGSFEAFSDLLNKQPFSASSLTALSSGFENSQPGDLLQVDPLSTAYHHLNSEVNPMLPPHTALRKSIHPGRHSGSFYMSGSSLSTHAEEPEGDRSPKGASNERENSSGIMLGQNRLSPNNRHKSLVDLIQEDFPRTPSPLFNQNLSSSHVEEPFDHDVRSLSLDSLSLKSSNLPEPKSGMSSGSIVDLSHRSTSAEEPSETSALDTPQKDELIGKDAYFISDFMSGGTIDSDAPNISKNDPDEQEPEFDEQVELHVQNTHSQHPAGYHGHGSQIQGISPQSTSNYIAHMNNFGMQPLHSPGGPPPIYANTAAYMNPGSSFYPNFSATGLYSPQYSGYAMNSSYVAQYLAGYPPHTSFPFPFNPNSGQSFSGQNVGFPTGENISKGSFIQNMNRFYGQHGLTMHPTFPDPLPLQYFQQGLQDPYNVPLQFNHLPSPGPISNRGDLFSLQNDPNGAAFSGDHKFPLSPSGNVGIPNSRKIGIPSTSYLSSSTGPVSVPQFRASPLGSPILPDSPAGGANSFGRQYDAGFSQNTAKNVGGYARWQGQRGTDNINDHKRHSFLEELKASSARRIDISDIVDRIVEFSIDQHGSRFIQQKLENCTVDEKELIFREVLPHASKLMTDVFGNYVIQKFFEYGTYEQRKELAGQLSKQMLTLSLQMYGCRVIQKALEVIEVDQKTELVLELDGHVMRCVRDQNGNHVIQKCIECVPPEKIDFIISAFKSEVASLSTHPYGCRVIQRVLEHCSDDIRCRPIVDEIMEAAYDLAHDQYGNYVTQHVLARGKPFERSQIISKFLGKIVPMSQHKYASNVVEKCLEYGGSAERECLIEEILIQYDESDNLLGMMKDQFANYVVQKIIEISEGGQRERILERIRAHLIALKKYTYGKHIVARFEQLMSEDNGSYEEA